MYCTWCGGHGAAQQPAVLQHKTQNGSSCQSTLGKFRDEEAAGGVQGAEEGSGVRLTCPNNQSRLFHSFRQPITAAHSSPREGEDAPPPNIYNNFFFLFWSLSSNYPHFLSDREIDFLKISPRRNNPSRDWVWLVVWLLIAKKTPRVCFVSWSCLISLFCVITVMAACLFSLRCAHWLIPITTSPLLVISQARLNNVSWSYLVLTSHVVPNTQPLTARVHPLTRVQVTLRTRWLLWQPGTRLLPTGVKRRSKPSGTDRQRLMEFEESGIGEECGVFGCVAAGEWPTQLEVAQILSLGLVALQHR